MGINSFSDLKQCTKKCNCSNLGNLILKDSHTSNMDSINKKDKKHNSKFKKDNLDIDKFFTNQIKEYLNDSNNEINVSSHNNNIHILGNTNIPTNSTLKNNDNNNISNNNHILSNNYETLKEIEKNKEDNSGNSNKDSFIKIKKEEKKEEQNANKYDKSLNTVSIIQYSLDNKEKSLSINIDLNNINIEDLINLIDINNIENNGTIIEYNGEKCIFKGKLRDKKNICGTGKLYYKDGRKYEGIFENGKLNGKGIYITDNGDIYEGIFNNGNLSGKGKITRFKEYKGKKNSSLIQEDSTRICQDNQNKIEYEGEIKDFKKEGKGKEKSDEYKYEGNYHNDMKNGFGIIIFFNSGDKYEGNFIDDEITGHGKYIWNNKCIYEGDFFEGKLHGRGIYKWPNGMEYDGEYYNNVKEGKGRFKWKNGLIFNGNFLEGKPDGKGQLIYKNKIKDVEYENGNFIGNFKEITNLLINGKDI